MKTNLKLTIAVALSSFICMNANAQVRSWTHNGSLSFNQTTGCGICDGELWSQAGEAHLDYDILGDANPLNAAYVDLAANNSCLSSTDCYYTKGLIVNDFQYSFPTNVTITITGIEVKIFARAVNKNAIKDLQVQLVLNDAPIGTDRSSTAYWSKTYSGRTYGSSTDTWGTALTPAIISDPGFGVIFKVQNMTASTKRFIADWVYVVIYYTVSN